MILVKVSDKIRPNQYEFKIPTKTPTTKYKQEYWKKQKNLSVDNLILNSNLNTSMKMHGKFEGQTTYQVLKYLFRINISTKRIKN